MELTRKNLIGIVVAAILLIAIPLGIYLAQKTQIFKPKATVGTPSASAAVTVSGAGVTQNSDGSYTVTSDKVDLNLTSPLGPPQPSVMPSPSPGG